MPTPFVGLDIAERSRADEGVVNIGTLELGAAISGPGKESEAWRQADTGIAAALGRARRAEHASLISLRDRLIVAKQRHGKPMLLRHHAEAGFAEVVDRVLHRLRSGEPANSVEIAHDIGVVGTGKIPITHELPVGGDTRGF